MKLMFDCDDTLYDLEQPFRRAVEEVLPDFPVDADTLYERYRWHSDVIFDLQDREIFDVNAAGIYRIFMCGKDFDSPVEVDTASQFQQVYRKNQYQVKMSPLFHSFFRKRGKEAILFSNGVDAHQRKKFHSLGIDTYIPADRIFTSAQLGLAKPDPKAFLTILDRFHENPSDWTYIGDHYINDMKGAHDAGMHTIHFNRHHRQEGDFSEFIVYSEQELIALIERLEKE